MSHEGQNFDHHPSDEEPEIQYSQAFLELISSDEKTRQMLEGSDITGEPWHRDEVFAIWERGRKFIAEAIKKDGSILDYGCANGFLLRCLEEWSEYKLDPYGYDIDEERIVMAKRLFPELENHFVSTSAEFLQFFPDKFDHIYWNVWDNADFLSEFNKALFGELRARVADDGRLILGFYASKEENQVKIEQLKAMGVQVSKILEAPDGGNEMVVCIDKFPRG